MTGKIIGYGGKQERSLDGVTYASVPGCKGVVVPKAETEYKDVTDLDSVDGFREWLPGLKDAGVIELPCHYTADGYEQQLSDQAASVAAGVPIYYRVTLAVAAGQSTGDVFEFRGYPTPSVENNDMGEVIGMTVSIRTSGAPDFTKGTAA